MDITGAAAPDLMAQLEPDRLLAAYEAVSPMPVRPEFLEGRAHVPQSPPDHRHSHAVMSLLFQLRSAAVPHAGTGSGYRFTEGGRTTALLVPDLYVPLGTPLPAPYPVLDTAPLPKNERCP